MNSLSTSAAMFKALCNIVGSEKAVWTRRTIMDMEEKTTNPIWIREAPNCVLLCHCSLSGSRRDGFRLPGSDLDIMFWTDNAVVFPENVQREHLSQPSNLTFYLKCVPSEPGFVYIKISYVAYDGVILSDDFLIKCLRDSIHDDSLNGILSFMGNSMFIQNLTMNQVLNAGKTLFKIHGPCFKVFMDTDLDMAFSFRGNFWPPTATEWIHRPRSWPPPNIIKSIVDGGCHFVAIGSKQSVLQSLEWRISFSKAENILVKSMNHCQFLTYGLLKIFFKEVVHKNDKEPLICSYYLKTVLFWKIQENDLVWSPSNFLSCVWTCFKQILQWVYLSYVPNFFIPDYNMLKGKCTECSRFELLNRLSLLYDQGLKCIFSCESIRNSFNQVIQMNYTTNIQTVESRIFDEWHFFSEVDHFPLFPLISIHSFSVNQNVANWFISKYVTRKYQTSEKLLIANKSLTMYLHVQIFRNIVNAQGQLNKKLYLKHKIAKNWLKISDFAGDLSMPLYRAMFLYANGLYNDAITILNRSKCILKKSYVIYNGQADGSVYLDLFHGTPLQHKFRNAVAMDVLVRADVLKKCFDIDFIFLHPSSRSIVRIPPLVFLHTLEVCCFKKIDRERRQRALHDLYFLVHFDKGKYVPLHLRSVSLLLLGFCQHLCLDVRGGFLSLAEALGCNSMNNYPPAIIDFVNKIIDCEG